MSSSLDPPALVPVYIEAGRFVTESENNHAGLVWISTLLCLIYSFLVLLLRAHLRIKVLSTDDYLAFVATILQVGQVAATIIGLRHGLGQARSILAVEQLSHLNISTFASLLLFLASLCFAKLAVVFLMMRLFNLNQIRTRADSRSRTPWLLCWAVVGIVAVWGAGSIVGVSVSCSVSDLMQPRGSATCPHQVLRWSIIGALDALTEIALVILSIVNVWPVQTKTSIKLRILFVFAFRLPCAAIAALHSYYVYRYANDMSDPTLSFVPLVVLMQIQLCWSLISATIPNLKSFVRSLNSGCGLGLDPEFMSRHGSSSNTRSRRGTEQELNYLSRALSPRALMSASTEDTRRRRSCNDLDLIEKTALRRHSSYVIASANRSPDGTSAENVNLYLDNMGSRDNIIRKDMHYSVHYEPKE